MRLLQRIPQSPENRPAMPAESSESLRRETMLVVSATLIVFLVITFIALRKHYLQTEEAVAHTSINPIGSKEFGHLSLEAKAVYVLDTSNNRVLFSKNASISLPLASITKIMSAIVAHETFPSDTIITITQTALNQEGDSDFTLGERWQLGNLLQYALVTSSNDAMTAIKEYYDEHHPPGEPRDFITAMNTKAQELHLSQTAFFNESGLDISTATYMTNKGSAQDTAYLLNYAIQRIPEILDETRYSKGTIASLDQTHTIHNTNEIINTIPWAVGSKTGFTDLAGGNLAISFDATIGRPIIIVVLGSSREGRFSDMKKLINATYSAVTKERETNSF